MVKLQRIIDKYVGIPLILLLKPFQRTPKIRQKNNVLFIKLWALGESILTLNLIKQFKEQNPNSKITVLCRNRNKAPYNQDFIDNIILLEKNNLKQIFKLRKKFDLSFDLEPYMKLSAILGFWLSKYTIGFSHGVRSLLYNTKIKYTDMKLVPLVYLDMLPKYKKPKSLIPLKYSKKDKQKIDKLIPKTKLLIGMTTTCAETSHYRRWPPEKFAELGKKLIEKYNATIIFPDIKENKPYINKIIKQINHKNAINLAGKTNLQELFYLTKKCDLYISNDTGNLHVSAAMGTKTIGLFGPNTPKRFGAYGINNINIYKCNHYPYINPHKGQFKKPKHYCMDKITVNDVMKAVEKLIGDIHAKNN